MQKFLFLSVLITLLHPNMFTITDHNGRVIHSKKMTHHYNAYLEQKESEYSLLALYNELHHQENIAQNAQNAKEQVEKILQAQRKATAEGKKFKLTKTQKQQLIEEAKYYKGGKYVWGGTTPKGFDCSGYVQYLYKKQHINLPRTAYSQSKKGKTIFRSQLEKGDLVFFLTDKKRKIPITHVGIYLGDRKFIHAASRKKGIIISSIDKGYYAKKFVLAKRVLKKII